MPPSTSSSRAPRIAVLGGGPAGLSAAYTAASGGATVDVFESQSRLGGCLLTETRGGFQYELGPASMTLKHPRVAAFLKDDLQLSSSIVERKGHGLYVLKHGKSVRMPTNPIRLLTTKLLSFKSKLGVFIEPFVPRLKFASAAKKETVAQFFQRRFTQEIVDYVVDPVIAGIYSGLPTQLSMKHAFGTLWNLEQEHGSVLAPMVFGKGKKKGSNKREKRNGVKSDSSPSSQGEAAETEGTEDEAVNIEDRFSAKELGKSVSLTGGMSELGTVLVERLKPINSNGRVRLNTPVQSLDMRNDGRWRINGHRTAYDCVVSTIPLYALRNVQSKNETVQRTFHRLARKVFYAPVAITVLGFQRSQVKHKLDAFGVLVPSVENKNILGIQFSSDSYPGRLQDEDHVYFTVYLGGTRNRTLTRAPARDVATAAWRDAASILGVEGRPHFVRVKRWLHGIPQYAPGYDRILSAVDRLEKKAPGLILGGNYRDGVGVSDAVLSGILAGERALKHVYSDTS